MLVSIPVHAKQRYLFFHMVYVFHHNTGAGGQKAGEGCCATVSEGTLFTAAPGKGMTQQNSHA